MSDMAQGPGWWQASDGKWYPPEAQPGSGQPAGGAGDPTPGGYTVPGHGAPGGHGAMPTSPEAYADWGTRVAATLIDVATLIPIYILAAVLARFSVGLGVLVYFVAVVGNFYYAFLTGEKGQSPGKALMGIKVVNETTGQPIGGGAGIGRHFVHILDGFCLIGYLFPLWDAKRQTFADKIMSTVVLPNQPKQSFGPDIFKP